MKFGYSELQGRTFCDSSDTNKSQVWNSCTHAFKLVSRTIYSSLVETSSVWSLHIVTHLGLTFFVQKSIYSFIYNNIFPLLSMDWKLVKSQKCTLVWSMLCLASVLVFWSMLYLLLSWFYSASMSWKDQHIILVWLTLEAKFLSTQDLFLIVRTRVFRKAYNRR